MVHRLAELGRLAGLAFANDFRRWLEHADNLAFAAGVAVLRHLEARERAERSNIRWPEEEHHAGPVELFCNIGSALYAFEHTGIEPFEGLVQLNQKAERVFGPIEALSAPWCRTARYGT